MEGKYNLYTKSRNKPIVFQNHEEFQEEDVWAIFSDKTNPNSKISSFDTSAINPRRVSTATRMIPRGNKNLNQEPKLNPQSAPVSIPDWSKIYGTNSKKPSRTVSFHSDDVYSEGKMGMKDGWDSDEDDDDEDQDGEMMPPHEWLAKKLARTRVCSFSVCEGAGRTLKGRDLRRVRNDVLTKTGFLE